MLRPATLSRRPGALKPQASNAPTPLRPHKRSKVNISASPSQDKPFATSSPRTPIDILADQIPDAILRVAVKEPVAFWGGVFAGVFRLSLDQDPLRSWVERTSAQAREAIGQTQPPSPPAAQPLKQ